MKNIFRHNKKNSLLVVLILLVATSLVISYNVFTPQNHTLGKLSGIQAAYGAGLTNTLLSPSNNIAAIGVQYVITFTTATTTTITSIDFVFPSTTNLINAKAVVVNTGIGAGTLSSSSNTLTYTITSPVSVPSGTTITLFLAKFTNPTTLGQQSITINVKNGATIIDTGTATFSPTTYTSPSITDTGTYSTPGNVGIGTTSPQQKFEVNGSIQVDGNQKISGNIVPSNNNPICIGTGC